MNFINLLVSLLSKAYAVNLLSRALKRTSCIARATQPVIMPSSWQQRRRLSRSNPTNYVLRRYLLRSVQLLSLSGVVLYPRSSLRRLSDG